MPRLPRLTVLAILALACSATAQQTAQLEAALRQDGYQGFMRLLDASQARWGEVLTYRALFEKEERRDGKVQPKEQVDYKFMRDHCIRMEWQDGNNKDKKVLFVRHKYGDQLNVQVKVLFVKARVQREPTASDVMEKTNHPITQSGFGQSLGAMRDLTSKLHQAGNVQVSYDGQVRGPDGQQCMKVTRTFKAGTHLRKVHVLFDASTLMPVQVEAHDAEGFLERYTYKRVKLNPKLANGRDEITEKDFYRSQMFSEDRDWGSEREHWKVCDVAPEWCAQKGR